MLRLLKPSCTMRVRSGGHTRANATIWNMYHGRTHSPSPPGPLRVSVAGVRCDRTQDWIVSVALLGTAIERLTIEGTKGHVEVKPGHKVRVADEGLAERDEIGAPLRNGFFGTTFVEAVIGHEESAKEPLDQIGRASCRERV